jgi:AbrB family looped-hinge helix DNA binding protein
MSLLRLLISFSHRPAELAVDVARQGSMNDFSQPVEVSLGRQGRLVIPAALRRELGFEEGDALVARQELGRLVLEKPEQIKQHLKKRLKQRFSQVPAERKLVDELIAERREGC